MLAQQLWEALDPPRRASVVMALLGLVLLGVTLVACVMIGAHWVRRMSRDRKQYKRSMHQAVSPQNDLIDRLPPLPTDETRVFDGRDTQVD
jgi:hypothetical protein